MSESTTENELTVPLLGTEALCNNVYDKEAKNTNMDDSSVSIYSVTSTNDDDEDDADSACETRCTMTCTLHGDDDQDDDNDNDHSCFYEHLIILFVLPILLFLQFWMALSVSEHHNEAETSQLDWGTVSYSIILFMISSFLYRKSINILKIDSIAIQLVPEICMDVVLALVSFHHVIYGFLFMIFATFAMALFSAISSCRLFVSYNSCDENIDDCKKGESFIV